MWMRIGVEMDADWILMCKLTLNQFDDLNFQPHPTHLKKRTNIWIWNVDADMDAEC